MGDVHELPTAPVVPEGWVVDGGGAYRECAGGFTIGASYLFDGAYSIELPFGAIVGGGLTTLRATCIAAERAYCNAHVGKRIPGTWANLATRLPLNGDDDVSALGRLCGAYDPLTHRFVAPSEVYGERRHVGECGVVGRFIVTGPIPSAPDGRQFCVSPSLARLMGVEP